MTDDVGVTAFFHLLVRFPLENYGRKHPAGTRRAKAMGSENADGLRIVLQ
jgi:hypothetical protein